MNKIDGFNKKYNQKKYAEDLLSTPQKFDLHKTYLSDLRLIAIYLRDEKNMKPKERQTFLEEYCSRNCENYNEVIWITLIQRAMNYSRKKEQKLKYIEYPKIYKFEFDYINELTDDERYRRILFAILCFYKYEKNRCSYEKDNYYIPNFVLKPSKLNKYCGIKMERTEHIGQLNGDLRRLGMINYSNKNEGQIIASFVSGIDYDVDLGNEDYVTVVNPENAYLYFNYFLNDKKIGFCKSCGDIFKKRANNQMFCKVCASEILSDSHIVTCCDCGREFSVKLKDTMTCRCEECQAKARKEQYREYNKKRKK